MLKKRKAGFAFETPGDDDTPSCPCCFRPGIPACIVVQDASENEKAAEKRLESLRAQMRQHGVDAYIVFTEDAHSSEYVSMCDQRRSYLTGFSGSAGVAVVTLEKALLWTDSRYFLQAEEQLATSWTLMKQHQPGVPPVEEWIASHLSQGSIVACDGALALASTVQDWIDNHWAPQGITFKNLVPNLVDAIWEKQPPRPNNPVRIHPETWAGEGVPSKLERVRKVVRDSHWVGQPDSYPRGRRSLRSGRSP